MPKTIGVAVLAVALAACGPRMVGGVPVPGDRDGGVVVIGGEGEAQRDGRGQGGGEYARSPGEVPPGHYPPPGECRIWYVNRTPGHQPPPARCESLVGRVPFGAFLLYNDKAWDTEYDWRAQERRRPGSVPDVVLRIMGALTRP